MFLFIVFDLYGHSSVKEQSGAYRSLVEALNIDTIILIDAGVDSILKGDEEGLGTFGEDLLSILCVKSVSDKITYKYLYCLGLGTEGGISEYDFLENLAALTKSGGFLGSCSLIKEMKEVELYFDALYSCIMTNTSINGQIVEAIKGFYGHHITPELKARGVTLQDLWIQPFMSIAWFFDLQKVIEYRLFLNDVKDAKSLADLQTKFKNARINHKISNAKTGYTGKRRCKLMFPPK